MDLGKIFTNKKRLILAATIFAIVLITVVYFVFGTGSMSIATFAAKRGEFVVDINTKGELKATKSVSVTVPRPRGHWYQLRIVKMVPEGTFVRKGDFLAQFDTSELISKIKEKENDLSTALADLNSLKAKITSTMAQLESELKIQKYSYEQAKLRLEQMKYEAEMRRREEELAMKKAEINLKRAQEKIASQREIDKASLEKAQLKVEQAREQLRQAQEELEGLTLRAPIDGLVVYNEVWGPSGRQKVKAGDTPWPGQSIIEIPDLASMYVKTSVNEVDINRLDVGQQVIIKVDALPDLTLYGKVSRIATLARLEKGTNTKVFDVDVTIEGTNPNLKPGMTASCQIITDRIPDALYVPVESVFEKEGKTVVYVLTSSAKSREVEVGQKNSDYIVIKKGLKEGERVTLRDPTKPLEELGGKAPQVQEKKEKPKKRRSEGVIIYY